MLQLNNLQPLTKKRKRIGRGGGRGGTSGRGETGQGSRTGANSKIGAAFEGGQMPLVRRIPRRGFNNVFKKEVVIVNLRDLEAKFNAGDTVDKVALQNAGLFKNARGASIKLLAKGELKKNLTVCVDSYSQAAADAVINAGGKVVTHKEN